MPRCENCGGPDFYRESGYLFCATCQTQSQEVGEEVEFEFPQSSNVRLKTTKIRSVRSSAGTEEATGWTSWELYNFALIGLTNELIELGAPADMKVTVLQLWARYLGKLEVAFMSTKKKLVPKLSRRYRKRDAEIIYGKIVSKSRKRKRAGSNMTESGASTSLSGGTSFRDINRNKKLMITADYDRCMQSQASSKDTLSEFSQSAHSVQSSVGQRSENRSFRIKFNQPAKGETRKVKELAKRLPRYERGKYKRTHVTSEYRAGPGTITTSKLLAILYLSLRIHNQDTHLGDMLRYGREGHLSYYRLDCVIPPEVALTRQEANFLSRVTDVTHKGMRRIIGRMAKFLGVRKIICPNFSPLISRYCSELALPDGIKLYAGRVLALSPPKLFDMIFDKKSHVPNYEGRAMAFIIVVMKVLLGLDGVTEYEISNVADRINSAISLEGLCDVRLFSFRDWQRYIECRRAVLVGAHCPTRLKYSPDTPDVNSLYVRFLESVDARADREPEVVTRKHLVPPEIVQAMRQCVSAVSHVDEPLNEVTEFFPSLTPHRSYLQQLLDEPLRDLPRILRTDFAATKIGYMTKPEYVRRLAEQHDMRVDLVDTNLHFVEKLVPPFEQRKMPSAEHLKQRVTVRDQPEHATRDDGKEDFTEYLHRSVPCEIRIDARKSRCYRERWRAAADTDGGAFAFTETLPSGGLSIPDAGEDDDDDDDAGDARPLSRFCEAHGLSLSRAEERALLTSLRMRPGEASVADSPPDTLGVLDATGGASVLDDLTNDRSSAQSDGSRDDTLRLFRPFADYWMYRCNFSRVKPRNFELLVKMLPRSFRWLLNECANVVEMPPEDVYEEVCVVEELLEKLVAQHTYPGGTS